ncbi:MULTISPECIES: hypothetical protein [unclassified Actinoplanes]|uniref:hypothetical protein n=1 Tax=unclassified Actinoplanes TaxID=2626549 RepID=UPI0009B064D8|nr:MULTISPECIES: hypothetical protein [unclassified Actinoplanes]
MTSTTSSGGNSLSAGTVALSDDDSAGAMFSATGIKPGDNGQRCITVTYNGTVASLVKVYAATSISTLHPYLDMVIEQGNGGSFANCGGFTGSAIYTGTLSALGTSFAGGAGTWAPALSGSTQVYRISWTLLDNYAAQSKAAILAFTWEAQST